MPAHCDEPPVEVEQRIGVALLVVNGDARGAVWIDRQPGGHICGAEAALGSADHCMGVRFLSRVIVPAWTAASAGATLRSLMSAA